MSPTKEVALAKGRRFVREHQQGLYDSTVERLFEWCYREYGDLYHTRWSVLSDCFFSSGTGYAWLDGQIVTWPDLHWSDLPDVGGGESEPSAAEALLQEIDLVCEALYQQNALPGTWEELEPFMVGEEIVAHSRARREAGRWAAERLEADRGSLGEGQPLPLRSLRGSIQLIPEDIQDDWLLLAHEALYLASTCGHKAVMRQEARELFETFSARFGERLAGLEASPRFEALPAVSDQDFEYVDAWSRQEKRTQQLKDEYLLAKRAEAVEHLRSLDVPED